MASDNFDPRFDDEFDSPHRRLRQPDPQAIKAKVMPPGVLMILIGVLSCCGWGYILFESLMAPDVDQQMEMLNAEIDAAQNRTQDEKQQAKELGETLFKPLAEAAPTISILGMVGSLMMVLGGVSMVALVSRGLGIIGSLAAIVPLSTGCGCLVGVPVGIWALVVLCRADVKSAFAAGTRPSFDGEF